MGTLHILSTLRLADGLLDQLRAVSPSVQVEQRTCRDASEVAVALVDQPATEVLYTFFLPRDAPDLAPGLRWIQLHTAGADHVLGQPITHSDVVITTSSGIHATPIAEYVFASMLAHRWQVPTWTRCQRAGEWPSGRWSLYARPELRGATLGIIGYGSIGREVGRLGHAFGTQAVPCGSWKTR